jgi:hypothetical protein
VGYTYDGVHHKVRLVFLHPLPHRPLSLSLHSCVDEESFRSALFGFGLLIGLVIVRARVHEDFMTNVRLRKRRSGGRGGVNEALDGWILRTSFQSIDASASSHVESEVEIQDATEGRSEMDEAFDT